MIKVQLIIDNVVSKVQAIEYSDGSCEVRFNENDIAQAQNFYCLTIHPETHVGHYVTIINQFLAMYVSHCLKNTQNGQEYPKFILNTPYLPHARADKRFSENDVSGLHSFIHSISLALSVADEWKIQDIHNPEAFYKVIDRINGKEVDLSELVITHSNVAQLWCNSTQIEKPEQIDFVFAPDKGAIGRTYDIFNQIVAYDNQSCGVITGEKVRNPDTGWITDYNIIEDTDITGKNVLIVDDICDGGMTFILAAKALKDRGANEVYLYVTHGIFSKGLDPLKGLIDKLLVVNCVGDYVSSFDIDVFNKG